MRHRRYDTESLVGDIKREKRNALLLSLLGLSILVFLVVYFTRLRGPAVPEVPKGASVTAVAPQPAPPPAPAAAAPAPTAVEPPKPPPPADAVVIISLPRPGPVFVDGELVAKKAKVHETKLSPGKHRISTRAGAKGTQLQLEAVAGKRYRVDLDPRKKKGAVEEVAR